MGDTLFEPGKIHKVKKTGILYTRRITPAIALCNPKYPFNVGGVVRAASCFGAKAVIFSGNRIRTVSEKGFRLPREERMKGYSDIIMLNDDYFLNRFGKVVTPVAVEFRQNSEPLHSFVHPKFPLYIFGPEDGSVPQVILQHCHRFVVIPSKHCLNLAQAAAILLYDRAAKLDQQV